MEKGTCRPGGSRGAGGRAGPRRGGLRVSQLAGWDSFWGQEALQPAPGWGAGLSRECQRLRAREGV